MKLNKVHLLTTGLLLMSLNCDMNKPVAPQEVILNAGPGKFGVSHMKGLGKTTGQAMVKQGSDAQFDLGNLKGSSSFFFLLYNIGSKPITNISLSIVDDNFTVYPTSMDSLIPNSDVGMLPILKVNAFHGTQLDGVGARPLMPKGKNAVTLNIKGTTQTASGTDTAVNLDVKLDVNALVLDVQLSTDNGTVDLAEPTGNIMSGNFPDHIPQMRSYNAAGCDVTLKNTGNIPLSLQVFYQFSNSSIDTSTFQVAAGSEVIIPKKNKDLVFCINGSNTITDQVKLPSFDNGKNYFYLKTTTANCTVDEDTIINKALFIALLKTKLDILGCTDVKHRMYIIDNKYVLTHSEGTCSSYGSSSTALYGKTPSPILALQDYKMVGKDPGGYINDQSIKTLFETIVANISTPNLGLSTDHTVEEVPVK